MAPSSTIACSESLSWSGKYTIDQLEYSQAYTQRMSYESREKKAQAETYWQWILYTGGLHSPFGNHSNKAAPDHETSYAEDQATDESLLNDKYLFRIL
jgi:hypothetical protein